MQKHPSSLTHWLILPAFLASTASLADDGAAAERQADWNHRLEQAAALKQMSADQQVAAKVLLEQNSAGCYKKFLVNSCLSDERKAYRQSYNDAARLESEGKAIERQVKKEQLNDADQRRLASARQQEDELQARATEVKAERQRIADEQAATLADKAKKAEEGAQRKAADAERLAQKRADHEARVAAKKESAARRAAESEGKAVKAAN